VIRVTRDLPNEHRHILLRASPREIRLRDDANAPLVIVHHGHASDLMAFHCGHHLGERGVSVHGDGWLRRAVLIPCDLAGSCRSLGGIQQIYLRDLHRSEARPLAGTEGAQMLAVSPDGQSVVFWAKGEISRAPLDGGPAETLVRAILVPPHGVAEGITGRVVFASNDGEIWQVSSGSAPTAVTSLAKGERQHALPQLLANDTVLLFTVRASRRTWGTEQVVAQVLATGERKLLLQDAADARYVPSGHVVFLRRGVLMAVPFDLTRLAVTGPPVGVLDGVAQALTSGRGADITGAGQFGVSASGALAYVPSPVVPYPDAMLVTVDRQGRVRDVPTPRLKYRPGLSLSPDGRRLAVTIATLTEEALWIADVSRAAPSRSCQSGARQIIPAGRRTRSALPSISSAMASRKSRGSGWTAAPDRTRSWRRVLGLPHGRPMGSISPR
jgi:hypothetical protein